MTAERTPGLAVRRARAGVVARARAQVLRSGVTPDNALPLAPAAALAVALALVLG